MKTPKKRVWILIVQVLVVCAVLFALGIAFFAYRAVRELPDPRDLARLLRMKTPTFEDLEQPTAVAEDSEALSSEAIEDPVSTRRIREKEMLSRLIEISHEDPRDIRVCEQLGKTTFPADQSALESKVLLSSLFSEERADSVSESFRSPLRAIFSSPGTRSVLEEIGEIEASSAAPKTSEEKRGFLEKVGFYTRVAKAAADLYADRERLEALGDRSMHLYALTRLAQLKPELSASSTLVDTCRAIQNTERGLNRTELEGERAVVLEHFRKAGVDPKSIGWNPQQWIRLQVKVGKDGFSISLTDREIAADSAQGVSGEIKRK